MITRFRVKNYKALRDVELRLTPLHVLIGPNDSGKTSILEALAALCRSVDLPLVDSFPKQRQDVDLVFGKDEHLSIALAARMEREAPSLSYEIDVQFSIGTRAIRLRQEKAISGSTRILESGSGGEHSQLKDQITRHGNASACAPIHDSLSGVQEYRWQPKLMALPVALGTDLHFQMEPSGFGLVRSLADLQDHDRVRFDALEARFLSYFPQFSKLRLWREAGYAVHKDERGVESFSFGSPGKALRFVLKQGDVELQASQVSDGALLILAYLAVLYLPKPPRVLLVEEPENGIHPRRLKDVLDILRELVGGQSHTQVLLTTHSPYVLDSFQPQEVTLCRRGEDGAVTVHRLAESKAVQDQIDVFTLGEIWSAEGDDKLAAPRSPSQKTPQ
jgi:predicted ATPase